MDYRLLPPDEMLCARPALPPSKSVLNRLAVISALTPGGQSVDPALWHSCEDVSLMHRALLTDNTEVDVHDSGTALRFLTACFAATEGKEKVITGSDRLRQRPVGELVDALRSLGAHIEYLGEDGYAPLRIRGSRLTGSEVTLSGEVSSQFASALLMAAPLMSGGLSIRFIADPVSAPYINLTISLMAACGIDCSIDRDGAYVAQGTYSDGKVEVEADWSAASFWYGIDVVSGGFVTLDGLRSDSMQPDARVASLFQRLGVDTDFEGEEGGIDLLLSPDQDARLTVDMAQTPDLVPSVVVTCALLGIPFHITGVSHLRHKESDRVAALIEELEKLGVVARVEDGAFIWDLRRHPIAELPRFSSHGDHRIAMAMAAVALFIPGIVIEGAECVEKSYPGFWQELERAGFSLLDADAPFDPEMPLSAPGEIRPDSAAL